jgi:hypothetical protein
VECSALPYRHCLTSGVGADTHTLYRLEAPHTKQDELPLHLSVFPPTIEAPNFSQYGLLEGTLEGVNSALERWKTTDDYKRKLAERSPQPSAGGSKRPKAEIEGPLTLTQLHHKYPSIFDQANSNIRPWHNGTQALAGTSQGTYPASKAQGPGLEEERFWRSDKYELRAEYPGSAKHNIMQENAMLRAQLDVAQNRLRQYERPPPWNANAYSFASIPTQPFGFGMTQAPGDDTFADPDTNEEVGKPIMWMRERQFDDKMTSADWNSEAMRVFAGDEHDGL